MKFVLCEVRMEIFLTNEQWKRKVDGISRRNIKRYGSSYTGKSLERQLDGCFCRTSNGVILDTNKFNEKRERAGLWGIVYFTNEMLEPLLCAM